MITCSVCQSLWLPWLRSLPLVERAEAAKCSPLDIEWVLMDHVLSPAACQADCTWVGSVMDHGRHVPFDNDPQQVCRSIAEWHQSHSGRSMVTSGSALGLSVWTRTIQQWMDRYPEEPYVKPAVWGGHL